MHQVKYTLALVLMVVGLVGCASGIALMDTNSKAVGYSSKTVSEAADCLRTFDKARTWVGLKSSVIFTIYVPAADNGDYILGNRDVLYMLNLSDDKNYQTKIEFKASGLERPESMQYLRGCSDKVVISQ